MLTSEGRPVAGALIVPYPLDQPPPPVPEVAVLSAADGGFSWPLPPGRYRLAALRNGREIAAAPVTVPVDRPTTVELVVGR